MAVLPDGRGDTASSEESTALDAYSRVVTAIAAKLTPQVAALRVQGSSRNGQRREGAGSAVVFTDDGFLLTNAHVVAGAAGGTAAFADGTQTPVDVIGADPLSDLAVLRARGYTPAPACTRGHGGRRGRKGGRRRSRPPASGCRPRKRRSRQRPRRRHGRWSGETRRR